MNPKQHENTIKLGSLQTIEDTINIQDLEGER